MQHFLKIIFSLAICALIAACSGGGGGSSSSDGGSVESSGSSSDSASSGDSGGTTSARDGFTLQVTDAPIELMQAVVLQFTEVRLRRASGSWLDFPLETPKSIDLLQLQGESTEDLLSGIDLPPGKYDEIRLLVDASPMTNYVDLGVGGMSELKIPSGSSSGLKIKGDFTVVAEGSKTMVIDFDLRQSIKEVGKSGKYMMSPVVRLEDADQTGLLRGQVNVNFLSSTPDCSDNDVDTHNAVYVYAGHDVIPEDIDHSSNLDVDPVATAVIKYVPLKAEYEYVAAFLPEGDYTTAITCNADLDDLDQGGDDLKFIIVRNVTVTAM